MLRFLTDSPWPCYICYMAWGNLKSPFTLTVYNVDRSLWRELRQIALAKGSHSYQALNEALHDFCKRHGSYSGTTQAKNPAEL